MGAIMETAFCICYLFGGAACGIQTLAQSRGNRQRRLFGALVLVLVCGDAFHLIPRIYGNLSGRLAEIPAALGFGTFVTSITMTVFYVLLYRLWSMRYCQGKNRLLENVVYFLAAARILICFHPGNNWLSAESPLMWGILRNIPFVMLGVVIMLLFGKISYLDKYFRFAWLAVLLSFLFYLPVVFFAGTMPIIGMLMLPKTLCYVWLINMGYKATKQMPPLQAIGVGHRE
ncbi:MAG: hypothetical protein LBS18_07605 [Clostridiales bacterium]|jgi:hypothetical protein|nr:hypothetical protein [Clostridiales bacterium]